MLCLVPGNYQGKKKNTKKMIFCVFDYTIKNMKKIKYN